MEVFMKQKKVWAILLFTLVLVSVFGDFLAGVSAAGKIKLNQSKISIRVGNQYQLAVENLLKNAKTTWTTSNKKKATVSKTGVVRAKKEGTVTIQSKVSYQAGGKRRIKKLTCKVTINKTTGTGNTLVVYFSVPEIDSDSNETVDAVASASIVLSDDKNLGNIQYVASFIQENTGADIFRIQPNTLRW